MSEPGNTPAGPTIIRRGGSIADPGPGPTGINDSTATDRIAGLLEPRAERAGRRPAAGYDELPDDERAERDEQIEREERRSRPGNDPGDGEPRESDALIERKEAKAPAQDAADEGDEGDELPDTFDGTDDSALSGESASLEEIEFEHGGKKYTVPKPLVDGALRHADYTKKVEAVRSEATVVARQRELIDIERVMAKDLAPAHAQLSTFHEQLKQAKLQTPDPNVNLAAYVAHSQLISNLTDAINQLDGAVAKRTAELTNQRGQALRTLQMAAGQHLTNTLPRWNAATAEKVQAVLHSEGYTEQEIEGMYDPRVLKLAYYAGLYQEIRSKGKAIRKSIKEAAPVVRPQGRPATANTEAQRAKITVKNARRSGRPEDAVNAIAALLKPGRR